MRKWTNDQEATIIQEVAATPDHLRDAFRRAAEKTGRTPEACTTRFYSVLMKRNALQTAENSNSKPISEKKQ